MTQVRGLCLASTSTQYPEGTASVSMTDTSWGPRSHRGTLTKHPSPIRTCRKRSVMIDQERFTQARSSCLEPIRSVGNVPNRRTVSLWWTRVPKPTRCYSNRWSKNWKEKGPKVLLCPSPRKGRLASSPWRNPGASAGRVW